MQRRFRALPVIASAAALTLLAACAPGGQSTTGPSNGPISTDVASMGDVTLTMYDFWQDDPWIAAAAEQFEELYPNVTIERTSGEWGQVIETLNLRFSDNDAPDIATVNNGWDSLGALAEAGLVLNLDPYSDAYGWADGMPSTVLRQSQFTADGSEMGSGSIFALPVSRSALIGLYYNQDLLDEAGVAAPTNLEEFEAACAALLAAGITPIAYGSLDQGSSTAPLWAAQDLFASADTINDFVYSSGSVSAADTGIGEAATTVAGWAENGWFTPSHEGVQYSDALDDFMTGEAAFRFEYTGSLIFDDAQQGSYGYAQLAQEDGTVVGTGSSSAILAVSARSEHPDAAAAFLDYLAGPEAAQLAVDLGMLPMLHSDLDTSAASPVFLTEIAGQQAIEADNGYVPYFDWSTPSMLATVGTALQELYAGRTTVDALVEAVQADYDAFQAR